MPPSARNVLCIFIVILLKTHPVVNQNTSVSLTVLENSHDRVYNVPGGYVVPLNGSITLRCHATSNLDLDLHWNIAQENFFVNGVSNAVLALDFDRKFSRITNGPSRNNPAMLRILHLQLPENDSVISCNLPSPEGKFNAVSEPLHIFVEDSPRCPGNVSVAVTGVGFTVTWDKYNGLLPATYNISVNSTAGQMDMFTTKTNIEVVIPRENGSVASNEDEVMEFTINVIACTSIRCSLDCKSIPYIYQVTSSPQLAAVIGASLSAVVLIIGISAVFVAVLVIVCIYKKKNSVKLEQKKPENVKKIPSSLNLAGQEEVQYSTVSDAVPRKSSLLTSPLAIPDNNPICDNKLIFDAEGYSVISNPAKSQHIVVDTRRLSWLRRSEKSPSRAKTGASLSPNNERTVPGVV